MDDTTMQKLQMVHDPAEKAAIIADSFFEGLSKEVAIVARYCVLLHWFDQTIVEALLGETTLSKSEMEKVYEQLVALSFVERLPWGQKLQDLTREGLLARYVRTDQEILKKAAHLAAPAYEARKENKKIVAEALFCNIIAGDQHKSRTLLNVLQEEAANNADWHYLSNLLRLQEEAEKFPFVRPLPRGEQDWMARGAVHQFQERMMDALADYDRVLARNPKNAFAYANRGTIYAEQEQYEKAISNYDHAIQLDPTLSQVHINRGIIYEKKEQYVAALQDFEIALQQVPQHTFAWCNKGALLRELERYEEALTAYEEALRFDPQSADAYRGQGAILNSLERYEEALAAYEEALRLDPQSVDAYRGRGTALFGLKRYEQASLAYEKAHHLESYSIDVDGDQIREEAESIYNQSRDQSQSVSYPARESQKERHILMSDELEAWKAQNESKHAVHHRESPFGGETAAEGREMEVHRMSDSLSEKARKDLVQAKMAALAKSLIDTEREYFINTLWQLSLTPQERADLLELLRKQRIEHLLPAGEEKGKGREGGATYVAIRTYPIIPGTGEEFLHRVQAGFVPIISRMPGFIAYDALQVGNDQIVSISVFDTPVGVIESTPRALQWVQENIAEFLQGMPEVMAGQVGASSELGRLYGKARRKLFHRP